MKSNFSLKEIYGVDNFIYDKMLEKYIQEHPDQDIKISILKFDIGLLKESYERVRTLYKSLNKYDKDEMTEMKCEMLIEIIQHKIERKKESLNERLGEY